MSALRRDQGGAAYTEFIIAFPVMLMLFLSLIQLALVYVGKLAVGHAAVRASRAAVVVLPDDPWHYGGEAVNRVGYRDSGSASAEARPGAFGFSGVVPGGRGSSRLRAIRSAASIPLAPLSPSVTAVAREETLARSFPSVETTLSGALLYNRGAVAVTFPSEPGSMDFVASVDPRANVTTRVSYLFHCAVPIVGRWMCHSPLAMITAAPDVLLEDVTGGLSEDESGVVEGAFDLYRDYFRGRDDLRNGVEEMQFVENAAVTAAVMLGGKRYLILRAEATMTNQGAGYVYR
ncbi:MAG: TadE/TadG family type IV pilus assembly protein [Myxococcota bacterium]